MTHSAAHTASPPRAQRPWQDWVLSLLLHAIVLAALGWMTRASDPTPQQIAIETPIEWAGKTLKETSCQGGV